MNNIGEQVIWEEKKSIERPKKSDNEITKNECVTTNDIKNSNNNEHLKDTIKTKKRRMMRRRRKKSYDNHKSCKKICKVCDKEFDAEASRRKVCSDECKKSIKSARHKIYYTTHNKEIKERKKQYRIQNREKIKKQRQQYWINNKKRIIENRQYYRQHPKTKESQKLYRLRNKEKIEENNKRYIKENKEYVKEYHRNYKRNKEQIDINFKLAGRLRSRLRQSLSGLTKNGSHIKDLGCSIEELKQYLESQFKPGMTWNNWTTDGWHIDHIKPLNTFNLTDRKQLLEACHYTNLRPLWANDNLTRPDDGSDIRLDSKE